MSDSSSKISWIRTADIGKYDVISAFETLGEIDWGKANFSISKGDVVYIYVGKPYSKIMFKTICVKDDVAPDEIIDDSRFNKNGANFEISESYVRLRLIKMKNSEKLSFQSLNKKELVKAKIMGAYKSTAYPKLFEYIDTVFSEKGNVTDKKILEKYMMGFKRYVENNPGGYPFLSFEGNKFLFEQEEYKTRIYHDVRNMFISTKITKADVGTGKIIDIVFKAVEKSENLIYHINAIQFKDKLTDFKNDFKYCKQIEYIFYYLYFENSKYTEQQLFDLLKNFFGGKYDVLAYLFYIKDYTRFFPLRSTKFDERFNMLNIDFTTAYNCSWDNYQEFISIILEIKCYLENYYGFAIRPIDAHSFLWQLPLIESKHMLSFDDGVVIEKERTTKVNARIGQGKYREDLISLWKGSCSVTDCRATNILLASHIKPWRDCKEDNEWLNPYNGLLLTPNLDSLFDKGFISFSDDGTILISDKISSEDFEKLGITEDMKLRFIKNEHKKYLKYHRQNLFQK